MTWFALALALLGSADLPRPDLETAEPPVIVRVEAAAASVETAPDDADAWGRYAIVLHAHSCDREADVAYAEAHRLDPAEFRWPYFRSIVAAKSDPARALELLERALDIDPAYGPAHERRGLLLEGLRRGDEAQPEFREAVRLFPGSPSAHLHLGQFELKQGRLDEAVRQLETARERWPDSAAVLSSLARVYARQGERDRAHEFAAAARRGRTMPLVTDPRLNEVAEAGARFSSFVTRAETYLRGGRPARAVQEFETALRQGHDPGRVHDALARVHFRRGAHAQCVQSARRALAAGHETTALRFAEGSSLLRLQQIDDAERALEAGLARSPTNAQLLRLRGQISAARGRDLQALEEWDEALAGRDDPVTRRLRAQALSRLGRHAEALAELSALVATPLAERQAWLALGDAHRRAGDLEKALASYDRAAQDRAAPLAGRSAAIVLIQLRRFTDAKRRLQDLRADWPRNPGIANDLAWLLSTCPEDAVRDGAAALALIRPVVEQTKRRAPAILDTYAAALAENGRFAEAAAVLDEALVLLPAGAGQGQRAAYVTHRDAYAAGRPWRAE